MAANPAQPDGPVRGINLAGIGAARRLLIIQEILAQLKPEAAYFVEEHGTRCALLIIDVADQSRIPFFAEPFFLKFNANCRFRIAMVAEDLAKAGLDALGQRWK